MREAILLLSVLLLFIFISSLDFSNTQMGGLRGFKLIENITGGAESSESFEKLADLNSFSNQARKPLFYVEGLDSEHYLLRTGVSTTYENGVWINDRKYGDAMKRTLGGKTFKVTPIAPLDFVPVTKDTVFVTLQAEYNSSGSVYRGKVRESYYGFIGEKEERAERTKIIMDDYEFEEIKNLAERITRGAKSDYEKLKRIEEFLERNYEYSHLYSNGKEDPVYRFLFVEKKGVCKHFASAFIVMAESIGIPARAVFGFSVEGTPRNQTVFSDQAHMWAEAFVDGKWIEFDPTPASRGKLPTETEIVEVSEEVVSGGELKIKGVVISERAVDGFVEVYIGKEKKPEILLGLLKVTDGKFEGKLKVPEIRGEYNVLAHFTGTFAFEESWSDPIVKIYEVPEISVSSPRFVPKNYVFEGRISVENATILVYVDGMLVKEVTAKNGTFEVPLNLTEGEHEIRFYYPGEEFIKPAEAKIKVYSGDFVIESEVAEVGRGFNLSVKVGGADYTGEIFINGKELFVENGRVFVPVAFEKAGYHELNVSIGEFKTRIKVKVMDRIYVELENDKLKVFDSFSGYNGEIIVNGKKVRVENGYANVNFSWEYHVIFQGDEFHYPAEFKIKRSPPWYLLLLPFLSLLILFKKPNFGIEFLKEERDLPNIWKVNEEVSFVTVNCNAWMNGRVVVSPLIFERRGKYEVVALKRRVFVTFKKSYEVEIVDDYGEAVVKLLEKLESTLKSQGHKTEWMTAREIASLLGLKDEEFIKIFEDYRYGKRKGYRREDFVRVWRNVRGVIS